MKIQIGINPTLSFEKVGSSLYMEVIDREERETFEIPFSEIKAMVEILEKLDN